jgi:hypothetical protein
MFFDFLTRVSLVISRLIIPYSMYHHYRVSKVKSTNKAFLVKEEDNET